MALSQCCACGSHGCRRVPVWWSCAQQSAGPAQGHWLSCTARREGRKRQANSSLSASRAHWSIVGQAALKDAGQRQGRRGLVRHGRHWQEGSQTLARGQNSRAFRLDSGEVNGSDAELGEGSRSAAEADGPGESDVTACNIAYGTRRPRCYDCSISGRDSQRVVLPTAFDRTDMGKFALASWH